MERQSRQLGPAPHAESAPAPREAPAKKAVATAGVVPTHVWGGAMEREFLRRARAGDTEAYANLVRCYQDAVFGLVARLVGDEFAAQELTQDAFLKAYRNLSGFREEARFFTWLYRIAVNLCHDYRSSQLARNRQKEWSLDDPDLHLEPAAPFSRPDNAVEEDALSREFEQVVNALDPIYRDAFVLRHQEGLGYDEISEALDISKSNAKVRVHRAREMVLGALRAKGYEV